MLYLISGKKWLGTSRAASVNCYYVNINKLKQLKSVILY